MEELKNHEKFEIEVLNRLNTCRLLDKLVFLGGTMLRLCHNLDRYSVDLDFWIVKEFDVTVFFDKFKNCLVKYYRIRDAQNKYYSMVFEIAAEKFERSLKIEIRKEVKKVKIEKKIAFSQFSDTQVLVNALTLDEMMNAKILAFIDRGEIRDVYDIEFLYKKGVDIKVEKRTAKLLIDRIKSLKKTDYTVKLSSIIEPNKRAYYRTENFKILLEKLREIVG